MKKRIILFSVVIVSIAIMSFDIMHKSGFSGYTKSPGEGDCSGCHVGNTVNASGGSITITTNPAFSSNKYVPGYTYEVSVKITRTGVNLFGFGFEALKTDGSNAGVFTITAPNSTQIDTAAVNGISRANVVHTIDGGASSGSHTFTFNWKAPAKGSGNVTFYTAGIAANGTGGTGGDYVYRTSRALTEDLTAGIDENAATKINLSVFPNPITESINLSYELNENAKVSAKLMSLNGQIVTTFFNEEQSAGKQIQQLKLDESISKGIYFLELGINEKQTIKKIVIQ